MTRTEARVEFADGEVTTPRLSTTLRRSVFWIVIAAILIAVALASLLTYGTRTSSARLSATNPGPAGAEALISVLRQDGVTVDAPRSLARATSKASRAADSTTLVIYDPKSILDEKQLASLTAATTHLVLILPSYRELNALAPSVALAGIVSRNANADCSFRPVARARSVSGLQQGYRILSRTAGEQGCLGAGGVYSLVRMKSTNHTVTVLGSTTVLTNQSIPLKGNAALALGLFGSTQHLVWYRPSLTDTAGITEDGTLPTPPWVPLTAVLLALVVIGAAVWRGRRLGPVVVERMPVTVRASETMEGRARLYQRASARTHALDALRIGALSRMAKSSGLPARAGVDEVIGAAATLTGRSLDSLRALLLDAVPVSDRELVRLSDELQELEQDVRKAAVAG